MLNLLRICEIEQGKNFPLSKRWAYQVYHRRHFPGLFLKIGRAVFIDLNKFEAMAQAGKLRFKHPAIKQEENPSSRTAIREEGANG